MLSKGQLELIGILKGTLPTAPADVAVENKTWYPIWIPKEKLNIGDRRLHNDILYEVYNNAGDNLYPPDQVPAVFRAIDAEHAGTLEDPYIYIVPMEVFKDKYYLYEGVKYLCIRDSGIPLNYTPDQLIDQYFKIVG